MVSVPYRGATFLNQFTAMTAIPIVFPSPIGELHFSMVQFLPTTRLNKVSVPYRGATFLNFSVDSRTTAWTCRRFRPLSGSYISQFKGSITEELVEICFRPLSGSYISQLSVFALHGKLFRVSVPYRGATFLNIETFNALSEIDRTLFPSPIGELHFSIRLWDSDTRRTV